jgi:hypothetical protein
MPRRLLKILSLSREPSRSSPVFTLEDIVWAMGSFCALNRKPFEPGNFRHPTPRIPSFMPPAPWVFELNDVKSNAPDYPVSTCRVWSY